MILCKIKDKKDFMGKLLTGDIFDSFLLKEALICGPVPFHIDGHINRAFFDETDGDNSYASTYESIPWKDIRPVCFDLIKGKKTPTRFSFVLYVPISSLLKSLLMLINRMAKQDVASKPKIRNFVTLGFIISLPLVVFLSDLVYLNSNEIDKQKAYIEKVNKLKIITRTLHLMA